MNLKLHDKSAFPALHWSAEVGKFNMKSIFINWFLESLVLISDAGTGTTYDRPSLVCTVHMTQIGAIIGTKLFRENYDFISF